MRWKISWLQGLKDHFYQVNEVITFDRKMFKNIRHIDSVEPIKVKGTLSIDNDLVEVDLNFKGHLRIRCANTDDIVDYPFNFNIKDVLDDSYQDVINYQKDFIDLYELTWQNLIVEAPAYYVKQECLKKEGKAWRLLLEDEYNDLKSDTIDPRFAKLKDLVIKDEEE
ncbi:MAG: DUF177 domain-containing protein [Bacilli bacterium]|jgi:uncharacterized metal-binding protein YceD (DUF177 family)|nr:DUF177 domain-containing protein [Bacilli bacterium]